MDRLSPSVLRTAPWVIFEPFGDEPVALAAREGFLTAFLRELRHRGQASAIAALVHGFLLFYPKGLPLFDQLRTFIATQLLPNAGGARILGWRTCVDTYGLCAPDAPVRVADRLATAGESPDAALDACCLRGQLAAGGLVRAAYRQFVSAVSTQIRNGKTTPAAERLLAFSRQPDDPKKLRFPGERVRLVDGLLLPFADGGGHPDVAERVRAFLLEQLGDPRLTGARHWHGIDPQAREVMDRWLVTETLEDFFRLLEYAAQDDVTARRHWSARKAFWSGYLRDGKIDAAWVALGPLARAQAHTMLSRSGETYAQLKKSYNVQKNHSAIIMRIGSLVITEWSHSGKFRAWRSGNRYGPRLHQPAYSRSELVIGRDVAIVHHSRWQQRVRDLIYEETGV